MSAYEAIRDAKLREAFESCDAMAIADAKDFLARNRKRLLEFGNRFSPTHGAFLPAVSGVGSTVGIPHDGPGAGEGDLLQRVERLESQMVELMALSREVRR